MTRGPAWPQGLPELPYVRHPSYAGQDVLLSLTFLTSAGVLQQPTTITYRIDSLETSDVVVGTTSVTPTSSQQTLQITGAVLQMTRQYFGRENMQVTITAVIPDTGAASGSITVKTVVIIEICAIATAS